MNSPASLLPTQSSAGEGALMATRCGHVALIGRPNVGKTTLLNRLVGEKLAAITRKPHTTRHRILGIVSEEHFQSIFVDTPGMEPQPSKRMNQVLNRTAEQALGEADLVCFLVEAGRFDEGDAFILERIRAAGRPTLLVINKVDRLADKSALLPFIAQCAQAYTYAAVVPLSARTGRQVGVLLQELRERLPVGPFLYDPEQLSDRPERFRAEEMIREALLERLGQEVPYAVAAQVERWEERPGIAHLDATIWVDRESQKGIVIGKQGQMLRRVGQDAREQLERLLGRKVMLRLTVRVHPGWTQSARALRELGIDESR
jgi:GTP-binding protein Era